MKAASEVGCTQSIKLRLAFLAVGLGVLSSLFLEAAEPHLEFARALRARGYGDMAVMYLQQISERADLPAPVRDVLDLELSNSYRVWSEQTADIGQATQKMGEAKRLLEQFRSQHPRHPGIPQAILEQGEFAFQRADRLWDRAKNITDPALRVKSSAEAQKAFEESLSSFNDAAERFQQLVTALRVETALPPNEKGTGQPVSEEVERQAQIGLLESHFKIGAAQLCLARSYPEDKPAEKTAALENAVTNFDWVYRRYPNSEAGLRALLWQAKATEELGRDEDAEELYDDVLLAEADATGKPTEIAAVFGQAAFWRLQLIARVKGNETARTEAGKWLKAHPTWRETQPYQGIALEAAKALLRRAKNEPPKLQEKFTEEAMAILAGVAAVPSEFQKEAIRLQRGGAPTETDTPQNSKLAAGDIAMGAGNWAEAVTAYEAAVEAAKSDPDKGAVVTARNRLNFARYRLAMSLFAAGKMQESLDAAALVAKSGANEPHAAEAASLTCFAALALCEAATDAGAKAHAESRLQRIAEFAQKTWPDQPAAHDAEIVLGQWEAKQGKWEAAVANFEKIPSSSPRFATASFSMARLYWKLARDEKRKAEAEQNQELIKKWNAQAKDKLQSVVKANTAADVDVATNRSWFDCCLLLAEIYLDEKQYAAACEIVEPLLSRFPLTGQATQQDAFAVAVHVVGLRALTSAEKLDAATGIAGPLAEFGPDNVTVNGALIELTRIARKEFETSRAAVDRVRGTLQQAYEKENEDKMGRRKELLQRMIPSFSKRKQLNLQSLVLVADTCNVLGLAKLGEEFSQRILAQAEGGAEKDPKAPAYVAKARMQLADLLREQSRFEEAAKHLEPLMNTHSNSLEVLMKRGELLQAWSKKDPKQYDACVEHWTRTRLLLSRVKPRPKEYYTVVYNTALCLVEQGEVNHDVAKARQAEQLLKTTLTLEASLDGPETVKKYQELLTRSQASGRATAPAGNKKA